MNEDLVSVIIPVYNTEEYIDKCIHSIVCQTYVNLEIILIDDGSTDSSGMLCDKWSNSDKRIVVIHKSNGGLSDARNCGLDVARGTYYAFVDSDDYLSLDAIEQMYIGIKNNLCEIAICNMIRISENGQSYPFYKPTSVEKILRGEKRFQTLVQPSVCNKLFMAKLFDNVRFPFGKYYEDTFIYHILLFRAKNVVMTGSDNYFYLERKNSIISRPQFTEQYFDFIEAVWYRAFFLLEQNIQPYANEACLSLYAAYSNAEKHIKKSKSNKLHFANAKNQFKLALFTLINADTVGLKQKIRLIILYFFPALHSILF